MNHNATRVAKRSYQIQREILAAVLFLMCDYCVLRLLFADTGFGDCSLNRKSAPCITASNCAVFIRLYSDTACAKACIRRCFSMQAIGTGEVATTQIISAFSSFWALM